jgi:hypothetical protein
VEIINYHIQKNKNLDSKMKKILLLSFLLCFLASGLMAQNNKHKFTLGKTDFLLDGKPLQIISGEMHPARIPQEYWRQRIKMAKAMGCKHPKVFLILKQVIEMLLNSSAFARRKGCGYCFVPALMFVLSGILAACHHIC